MINNNSNQYKNNTYQIENSFIMESIKKTSLTRSEKINAELNNVTLNFLSSYNKNIKEPIDVVKEGRIAILDYLNNLSIDEINKEIILFLDSCRMAVKDSNINNHKKINNIINIVIKDELYA